MFWRWVFISNPMYTKCGHLLRCPRRTGGGLFEEGDGSEQIVGGHMPTDGIERAVGRAEPGLGVDADLGELAQEGLDEAHGIWTEATSDHQA